MPKEICHKTRNYDSKLNANFYFLIIPFAMSFNLQFALAGMYYAGSGVKQNFETSYTLFQVILQCLITFHRLLYLYIRPLKGFYNSQGFD